MTCLSPNSRLTVSNELVNTAENLVMTKIFCLTDQKERQVFSDPGPVGANRLTRITTVCLYSSINQQKYEYFTHVVIQSKSQSKTKPKRKIVTIPMLCC